MANTYYERYQKCLKDLEEKMVERGADSSDAKKLRGAVAVEVLKDEILKYLSSKNLALKISSANSYIMGSKYEYDLLLVKENAEPYLGLLYEPEDVVAVIESKAGGLFDVEKDVNSIAAAFNRAKELNPEVVFGYITLSENVPKHEVYRGKQTVKHWDLTNELFDKKIMGDSLAVYAVTLHTGDTLCEEGSDEEFHAFVDYLIRDYQE